MKKTFELYRPPVNGWSRLEEKLKAVDERRVQETRMWAATAAVLVAAIAISLFTNLDGKSLELPKENIVQGGDAFPVAVDQPGVRFYWIMSSR